MQNTKEWSKGNDESRTYGSYLRHHILDRNCTIRIERKIIKKVLYEVKEQNRVLAGFVDLKDRQGKYLFFSYNVSLNGQSSRSEPSLSQHVVHDFPSSSQQPSMLELKDDENEQKVSDVEIIVKSRLDEANNIGVDEVHELEYTEDHILHALDLIDAPSKVHDHQWESYKAQLRSSTSRKLSEIGKKARGADGSYVEDALRNLVVKANKEISRKISELGCHEEEIDNEK
nr:hypothetical protein [Tanacetum cinerariifolium]